MLRYLIDKYYEWSTKGNAGVFYAPAVAAELKDPERRLVDEFHDMYYRAWQKGSGTIDISWQGYRTLKCPMDMWTYQEIIFETRPDLIIETGTFLGGSALFMASICDLVGNGKIVSIDLKKRENLPQHPRISYWTGSSVSEEILQRVRETARGCKTMVILDSDHAYQHVKRELELYAPLVSSGCYLIVEDTNVNGHPTNLEHGPGPWEAASEFMTRTNDFKVDKSRERFLLTLNPNGYLKRL